jgi:hypothetical protein
MDDGGMSIRLDPRRLNALKLLAAEAGVRPGELVTRWVEERLDAARPGSAAPQPSAPAPDALRALSARVDELARRIDALTPPIVDTEPTPIAMATEPKRRGRTPKAAVAKAVKAAPKTRVRRIIVKATAKVALHDEISAVIRERGPQTAAELASAITERGRYLQPRSTKPLDAATVNARVSNPKYRPGFVRREGRIGLAE